MLTSHDAALVSAAAAKQLVDVVPFGFRRLGRRPHLRRSLGGLVALIREGAAGVNEVRARRAWAGSERLARLTQEIRAGVDERAERYQDLGETPAEGNRPCSISW